MKNKKYLLVLLLLLSLIPLFDLFHPGLPVTHDGQDHVARIANFYQSLSEGNIIPRWAGNLNWGYGHPILMFLYPLSSYIASSFHFLGFDFVDSTKVVFGLSFILSGIFMYLWIREIWGEKAGFMAGMLYMFAPYHFVDLYVRGAIGENLAFIWPPLICYFLLKKNSIGIALSVAFLLLSHNALALMFLPVIFGYMGYLILISKRKIFSLIYNLSSIIFGFALSAFFWLPAFVEGKYTLRDIVTKNNITGFIENYLRLIWSSWSYEGGDAITVQLGILQWGLVLIAPLLIWIFWRRKDSVWLFLSFILLCFWVAIFFMLPPSRSLYFIFPLLQKFQFVWRFLSLAIFPPAVFAGATIWLCPKKCQNLLLMVVLFSLVFLNKDYWHAQDFSYKDESFYRDIYDGTTDTGESGPRWSVRFMEHRPKTHSEVISGKATIEELDRTSTQHKYEIVVVDKTRIRENTLYFPGWVVLVDGQPVNIEFQDPLNRGLMTFFVEKGRHQVLVQFRETKLRLLADIISLVSLVILALFGILKGKNLWQRFRWF